MTISVTGPDGSTFDFPEGTASDVVKGALAKHYGASQTNNPPSSARAAFLPQDKRNDVPDDWSPDQVAAYDKERSFQKANPTLRGGYASRMVDSATFGATPLINSAVQATLELPGRVLSGDPTSWNEARRRHFAEEIAKRNVARSETDGVGGLAADLVGGLAMAPAGAVNAAGNAARLTIPQLIGHGAVAGAQYGAANSFIGSNSNIDTAQGVENRLAAVPEGVAGGAVLGGLLSGAVGVASNALARRTDRINERVRQAQGNLDDFNAAGVEPLGPVISTSPMVNKTAQGMSGTMFGQPLKDAAARSITSAEKRAQETLRQQTEGLPSNDLGEEAQGILRRNLTQYSVPHDDIRAASRETLEGMTGPLTDQGFLPPRPVIEPTAPRQVDTVVPRYPDEANLPPPQLSMAPSRVISEADVNLAPMDKFRLDRAEIAARSANEFLNKSRPALERMQDEMDRNYRLMRNPAIFDENAATVASSNYNVWRERSEALTRRIWDAENTIAKYSQTKGIYEKQIGDLVSAKQAAENERIAKMRPEMEKQARERQIAEARAQAEREAHAETEAARERARLDAESDTRSRTDAANRTYDEQVAAGNLGFRAGRSRETYPSEFSAAYEMADRETPRIQANPLLGKIQRKGDGQLQSATSRLLDELGNDARGGLKLPGYKAGQPFDDSGRIQGPLMEHLRGLLGKNVADRLEVLSDRRALGQFVPDHEGMRSLRTEIRRAAEEAEHPPFPAQARPDDAAALRRLYSALSEDMDRSLRNIGPEGQRAADMHRSVDAEYGQHAREMRKPLAKLFGEKVSPIQAMDRVVDAATGGDLRLLRSYVRVMEEKASPTRAAAGIVAHLTDNAKDLPSFIKGFEKIPTDVRNELFRTPAAQAYRRDLEAIERVGRQLLPYYDNAQKPSGIDLSKKSNLFLLASAWSHFYATLSLGAGVASVSRFMASPRYVRALTQLRPAPGGGFGTREAAQALGMIGGLAAKNDEFGKHVLAAAWSALATPAKAQGAAATGALAFRINETYTPQEIDDLKNQGVTVVGMHGDSEDFSARASYAKRRGLKVHAYNDGNGDDFGGRFPEDKERAQANAKELGMTYEAYRQGGWLKAFRKKMSELDKAGVYSIEADNINQQPDIVKFLADHQDYVNKNGIKTKLALKNMEPEQAQAISNAIKSGKLSKRTFAPYGFAEEYMSDDDRKKSAAILAEHGITIGDTTNTDDYKTDKPIKFVDRDTSDDKQKSAATKKSAPHRQSENLHANFSN